MISADLFESDIDERRKQEGYNVGYNDVTIDKDDVYNILSYEDTTPWWQIWGASYESSEFANVKAIEEITDTAMQLLVALPVLYWLVKFAVWLVTLLLKGIGSVFRGIGNAAKKRKKNERKNE